MKPIVNFNERLNGMKFNVNGKEFRLTSERGVNMDSLNPFYGKDVVCIYPKDVHNKHYLFQIRWNDMGFDFFRMQTHKLGKTGFEKVKILSGYFSKDDCKDPIRFVNNTICRIIDQLMSNDIF